MSYGLQSPITAAQLYERMPSWGIDVVWMTKAHYLEFRNTIRTDDLFANGAYCLGRRVVLIDAFDTYSFLVDVKVQEDNARRRALTYSDPLYDRIH